MSHTPGPWRYEHDQFTEEEGPVWVIEDVAGTNMILARIFDEGPVTEANASLIAAAPDLLAAAELAIHKIEQTQQGQYPEGQALDAARNALVGVITKAKGESK